MFGAVNVNIFPSHSPVSDLAEPGTFAGNDAIVAFARSQQVKVVIHQLNAPLWEVTYNYLTLVSTYPFLDSYQYDLNDFDANCKL